jgi:hypothetical protein
MSTGALRLSQGSIHLYLLKNYTLACLLYLLIMTTTDLPCTLEISEFSQALVMNLNEILKLNLTYFPDKNTTLVIIIHLLHKLHNFMK